MSILNDNPLPTSKTFDEMTEDIPPISDSYLDDEFSCVSDEIESISTKVSGVYKKKNKSKSDRKGDKTIKYVQDQKVVIETFSTSDVPGSSIKSAADGIVYTGITVGSFADNLFFKVRDTTLKDGLKTYYYSTPEEYERHTLNTINDDIKQQWSEKYAYVNSILKMNL